MRIDIPFEIIGYFIEKRYENKVKYTNCILYLKLDNENNFIPICKITSDDISFEKIPDLNRKSGFSELFALRFQIIQLIIKLYSIILSGNYNIFIDFSNKYCVPLNNTDMNTYNQFETLTDAFIFNMKQKGI